MKLTLDQYIMNVLQNYCNANRTAGNNQQAEEAQRLLDDIKAKGEAARISLETLRQLAENTREETSRESMAGLYNMLMGFWTQLETIHENPNAAIKPKQVANNAPSIGELKWMPSVRNWNNVASWNGDPTRDSSRDNRIAEHNASIEASVDLLADVAKGVHFSSDEFNEFQKAIRKLNDAVKHPERQLDTDKLLADALEKGQKYLDFKARDTHISDKGRKRVNAVNTIIRNLSRAGFVDLANERIIQEYQTAREHEEVKNRLENEKNALQAEKNTLVNERNALQTEKNTLVNENTELKSSVDAANKSAEQLGAENTVLKNQSADDKAAMVDLQKRMAEMQEILQNTRNELKTSQESFTAAQNEITALNERLAVKPSVAEADVQTEEAKPSVAEIQVQTEEVQPPVEEQPIFEKKNVLHTIHRDVPQNDAKLEEDAHNIVEGIFNDIHEEAELSDNIEPLITEEDVNGIARKTEQQKDMKEFYTAFNTLDTIPEEDELKYEAEQVDNIEPPKAEDQPVEQPKAEEPPVEQPDDKKVKQELEDRLQEIADDIIPNILQEAFEEVAQEEQMNEVPQPLVEEQPVEQPKAEELPIIENENVLNTLHKEAPQDKIEPEAEPPVEEPKAVPGEETMERERTELASSVKYLLDYKNAVYPKYVEERRKLDAHLNKAESLGKKAEELAALGLNEEQNKKIGILSGDAMNDFRAHMSMSLDEIAAKAKNGGKDLLDKTLGILCFTYFNESMNKSGNTLEVPQTGEDMNTAAAEMGKLFGELDVVQAWRQNWDLTTPEGCQKLHMLHTNMPAQMKFMSAVNEYAKYYNLFDKFKKEPDLSPEQPDVKQEEIKPEIPQQVEEQPKVEEVQPQIEELPIIENENVLNTIYKEAPQNIIPPNVLEQEKSKRWDWTIDEEGHSWVREADGRYDRGDLTAKERLYQKENIEENIRKLHEAFQDGGNVYGALLGNGDIKTMQNLMDILIREPRYKEEQKKNVIEATTQYIDCLNKVNNTLTKQTFRTLYEAAYHFQDVMGDVVAEEGFYDGSDLFQIAKEHEKFLKEMWPEEAELISNEMTAEMNAKAASNPIPPKPKDDAQAIAEAYASSRVLKFYNNYTDLGYDNAKTKNVAKQAIAGFMVAELCRYEKLPDSKNSLIAPLVNSNKMDELVAKIQKSGIIDKNFDIKDSYEADNLITDLGSGRKRHKCLTAGLEYLQTQVKKNKTHDKSNKVKTQQNEKSGMHK